MWYIEYKYLDMFILATMSKSHVFSFDRTSGEFINQYLLLVNHCSFKSHQNKSHKTE